MSVAAGRGRETSQSTVAAASATILSNKYLFAVLSVVLSMISYYSEFLYAAEVLYARLGEN